MIEAKEIDGELWIKASDHHQSVKKAIEHEREACAKDCEGINSIEDFYGERPELICAKAIREKSKE
jgi:hypothetical protein